MTAPEVRATTAMDIQISSRHLRLDGTSLNASKGSA
jgi:hypothetical protein